MQDLPLSVGDEEKSVQDLVEWYFEEEIIEDYKCEGCDGGKAKLRQKIKQESEEAQKQVIVSLCRFKYSKELQTRLKINT